MLSVILLLLFSSCSFNFVYTATPYKACDSTLGTIQAFDVTGCTTIPCKFTKGNTYSMNLTFQATAPSSIAKVSIHGIIAGVPIPFPLADPDACKLGVKCPIVANDVNTAMLSLPVLTSYPAITLYVKIEITTDDKGHDYACLKFPAAIINSDLNPLHGLVNWKRGKLFEMLNQHGYQNL